MKTIAFLVSDITRQNGTERAVVNTANTLNEIYGYKIFIISECSVQGEGFPLNRSVKIIHLNRQTLSDIIQTKGFWEKIVSKVIYKITFIFSLIKIVRKYNIQIVIGTNTSYNCHLCFLKGVTKRIGCEHFAYHVITGQIARQRRMLYPFLDKVVLLTQRDAERYSFIASTRCTVIPNIRSFSCEEPAPLVEKKIIAIGRLNYAKGFEMLLKSAVLIKKNLSDWHIDIYGAGELEKELREQLKKLNLEQYVYIHSPTKNIKAELCNSSIYACSSRFEGLPMTLLEAQSVGVPIVSFDCPNGPSEIITDGEDGFLVPQNDTEQLALKVIFLAKNDEIRKRFGKKAFLNSMKFSKENISKLWHNCIENL